MMYTRLRSLFHSAGGRSAIVKRNILWSLAVKGYSIIIQLLIVPLTLGYVSSELYGIWLTLSSIMLWLNFFDVGFTLGLKNKLTEAIALKQWERGRSLVSTTYMMMAIIFLPLCIVLELLVPAIDWSELLNVPHHHNQEITRALHVLVACFCMQMFVNVISSVVAAFQKTALASAFPVIGNTMSLIAIFALTRLCPPSLTALSAAVATMPVAVMAIASVILFSNSMSCIAPSLKTIDKHQVKDLFGLGAKFFLIQIQVVIMFQTTNILISNLSGPDMVTEYNIAYKYLSVALMAFNIILTPLWPAFTDAYTRSDYAWMKGVYRKMTRLFMLSAAAIAAMAIIAPFSYRIWIGDKASVPNIMTMLVSIYVIANAWDSLQVMLINGMGRVKLQTYVTLIGLVLHIPLAFVLGRFCNMRGYGVIASMTIITFIYISFFSVQVRRLLNRKACGIWAE